MRYFYLAVAIFLSVTMNAQPIASFSVSRNKVCSGTKVLLNNTSTGATSYSWYINDVFYSNNIHDSAVLIEPCYDLQPIKLIAFNNTASDSHTAVVEVFDTCAMHLHGDYTNCVGDTIRKNARPDAISYVWNISPPHTLLSGCDTCDSISFVLAVIGTTVHLQSTYEGGCSQPVSYHYFMCNPLIGSGIEDVYADKIKIFPNPATDRITIENKTNDKIHQIQLYNTYGSRITLQRSSTAALDISQLSPGIYILEITLAGEKIIRKIVKQ